jgi:hypothetical protein
MNELFDRNLLDLFQGLWAKSVDDWDLFIVDAQALACVFMLLYFAAKAYPMMAGDKPLELMPLLRPFALALVIIFWVEFVTTITYPFDTITNTARGKFYEQLDDIEALARHRYALIDSVSMELITTSLEVERAEDENRSMGEKILSAVGIDLEEIANRISGLWLLVQARLKFTFCMLIERIVIIFFQFCTYIVFFLQIIFASVMVILGPIAFALSVLPAFRDTYIYWLSRYIGISLYSAVGYVILSVSLLILEYGLEKEIEILQYVLNNEAAFFMYVTKMSGDITLFVVTALVGGVSMLTVPVVSTWIVQTSGAGQAIGTMAGGTMAAAKVI